VEPFAGRVCQVPVVNADAIRPPVDPLLRAAAVVARPAAIDVAELYRDHRRRLVGLAAAVTLDAAAAEEIVQDAFEGLQRHAHRVDQPLAYLQRSVVNLGINRVRRRQVAERHPPAPPTPIGLPEIDETWAAVVRLPPNQRAVVVLRFWQDMTLEAIADTLGRPVGSIKSTLHRALRRLESELT
jgi:DNA-directed RNA polymerase specialized sigma24 family protein